jgi:hypothetical protein
MGSRIHHGARGTMGGVCGGVRCARPRGTMGGVCGKVHEGMDRSAAHSTPRPLWGRNAVRGPSATFPAVLARTLRTHAVPAWHVRLETTCHNGSRDTRHASCIGRVLEPCRQRGTKGAEAVSRIEFMPTRTRSRAIAAGRSAASLPQQPTDILNLIAAILDDTLEPWHLNRFATTSRAMKSALEALLTDRRRAEHEESAALLEQCGVQWRAAVHQRPVEFEGRTKLSSVHAPVLCRVLQSDAFARLQSLAIQGCRLGDAGADVIAAAAAAGGLAHLTEMYLSENGLSPSGCCALVSCLRRGFLPTLRGLFLHFNDLGDAGVRDLAEALQHGALPVLAMLGLIQVGLEAKGMKALMAAAEYGGLPRLRWLFVNKNAIGEAGAEALAVAIKANHLAALERINISSAYRHVNPLLLACEERGVRIDSWSDSSS